MVFVNAGKLSSGLLILCLLMTLLLAPTAGSTVRINPDNPKEIIMSELDFRFYEFQAELVPELTAELEETQKELSSRPTHEQLIIGFLAGACIGALVF